MTKFGLRRMLLALLAVGISAALTGCNGFFVPVNSTTGGSSTVNYAYVLNGASATISGYALSSGQLVSLPSSPYALNFTPMSIIVTPDNKFVYVGGTGILYVYAIQSDGSLKVANGGIAVSSASEAAMDITSDGAYLFGLDAVVGQTVVNSTQTLSQSTIDVFQIDKTTGVLNTIAAMPYNVSNQTVVPLGIKVSPNRDFLFAAIGTAGDLFFNLDPATGTLTNGRVFNVGTGPASDNALTVDSTSTYLYVARSGVGTGIVEFTIATGGLTQSANTPFAAGNQPSAVVLDTTGKYAYVANRGDKDISGYTVGTAGALTPLASSPYVSGTNPTALAVDSSGKYLLAVSSGGSPDVSMYSIGASVAGALVSVSTISPGTSAGPIAIALTH